MGRSATGSFPFAALGGMVAPFLFPCFELPANGVTKSEQGRAKGRSGEKQSKGFLQVTREEREPQTLTLITKHCVRLCGSRMMRWLLTWMSHRFSRVSSCQNEFNNCKAVSSSQMLAYERKLEFYEGGLLHTNLVDKLVQVTDCRK